MVTRTRMTLEEFLALPEEKPYLEFVNGEVVQKAMPTRKHSRMVAALIYRLEGYLQASGLGEVNTELRHYSRSMDRVYLPDLEVVLKDRRYPDEDPVPMPPDLAIEILSPDDRASRVLDRVDFLLREGVRLAWIVDPETHSITVYRPGAAQEVIRGGTVKADPVLPGFSLDVDELFATAASD